MALSEIFMESYRSCCNDSQTRIKVLAKDNCLEFNADRLEEADWQPLLKALRNECRLHTLAIKSDYVGPQHVTTRQRGWTAGTILARPVFHKAYIMDKLTESIVDCMKRSDTLTTLHLQAIPFTHRHVKLLAEGIRECESLKYLLLTHFDLEDKGLATLYETLYLHVGLNIVDLSGCGLTDSGAEIIAQIIRKLSVRYRKTSGELVPGVRRFTLNDNPAIGDNGFLAIIHEMMFDLWVKCLDMQNCGLTDISGKESLDLVTVNDNISVLDISRNDKISVAKKKEVKQILMSRKKPSDKPADIDRYDWLDCASEMMRTGTSIKPNSQQSLLRVNSFSGQKNVRPVSQSQSACSSMQLDQTKRDLDGTRQSMVKERQQYEQLERERQQQKAVLDQLFTKPRTTLKQVQKEQKKVLMERKEFFSEEHIPKLIKSGNSKRMKTKPTQEAIIVATKKFMTEQNKTQNQLIEYLSASSGDPNLEKPKKMETKPLQEAPVLSTTTSCGYSKSDNHKKMKARPTQDSPILAAKIYSAGKENSQKRLPKSALTTSGDPKTGKRKRRQAKPTQDSSILAAKIYSTGKKKPQKRLIKSSSTQSGEPKTGKLKKTQTKPTQDSAILAAKIYSTGKKNPQKRLIKSALTASGDPKSGKPKKMKAKATHNSAILAEKIYSTGKEIPKKRLIKSSKPKRKKAKLLKGAASIMLSNPDCLDFTKPELKSRLKEESYCYDSDERDLSEKAYSTSDEVDNTEFLHIMQSNLDCLYFTNQKLKSRRVKEESYCYDSDERDLSAEICSIGYQVANTQQLPIMQSNLDRLNFTKPKNGLEEESYCYDSDERGQSETDESALEPISTNAQPTPQDPPVAKCDPRTLSPTSRTRWIFNEIMLQKSKGCGKNSHVGQQRPTTTKVLH